MTNSSGSDVRDESAPTARRQETRMRLLDAAAEVFVEEGFQGAAVEAVCARAGFSRGAFYSNFESKEELFIAALTRVYEQKVQQVADIGATLAPTLRERNTRLTAAEAADYISDLFAPSETQLHWFALETEFLLLSMRDPSVNPGFAAFLAEFTASLATLVDGIVAAAGREFTIPSENALAVLASIYERGLRISAIAGNDAPEGIGEMNTRIAEVLFALTVEVQTQPHSNNLT